MSIPFKSQLAVRQIDKLSESEGVASLTQYTESTVDSYGDESYTEVVTPVKAVKSTTTNTRMPFVRSGELGYYYMMQIEFFTTDDIVISNNAVNKPPTLLHEGLTYEVTEVEKSKNGLIRYIGYRERI